MCSKNIISETQFGFRKNYSTNHAIQHSVNFINESHLTGKHVLGIFIDLSKAFDTIDHKPSYVNCTTMELEGPRITLFLVTSQIAINMLK